MKQGFIKTQAEIAAIAEGGKILHEILEQTAALVAPGITTWRLDEFAHKQIQQAGGRPSFLGYGPKKNPFPAALCTSVNNVVVHGIPSKTAILKQGDIVSLDIGMEYKKLYTDMAITVAVGKINSQAQLLMDVTKKSLQMAIKQMKPGNRIGDISWAIQKTTEDGGFSVVRDLVGHGVGYDVHEDPAVPCYGKPGRGITLEPGMVLAVEPMVTAGEHYVEFDNDG